MGQAASWLSFDKKYLTKEKMYPLFPQTTQKGRDIPDFVDKIV